MVSYTKNLAHIRHDLSTHLNHIVGYCEILLTDAREYRKLDLIPGIEDIIFRADRLKRLIRYYFYESSEIAMNFDTEDIRTALYQPLVQILSDARRLIVLFKEKAPGFVKDMEQLISAAKQMYEMIESEMIDLELNEISSVSATEPTPVLSTVHVIETDESIEGNRARNPGRILVVDDSPAHHRLMTRHLSALGHQVSSALSGDLALEALSQQDFDIIILDLLMPQMTGFNFLRILKQSPTLSLIPVIMMSAMDNPSNIAECIKRGAEDYLSKDFDPMILKARLDACMEKKQLQEQQSLFVNALVETQQALAHELSEAASYIVSMLPEPMQSPVMAAVALVPSAQLGGDFCGFHWLDANHLALYLMDVSGHGIKSALLAISLSNVIKSQGMPDTNFSDPGQVLGALNKNFQAKNEQTIFFSIWYGVCDITTGILTYACGGSPPASVVRAANPGAVEVFEGRDLVLGADEDYVYPNYSETLRAGDRLYLFSDGLYEIRRSSGKCLGLSDFQNLLPIQTGKPVEDIENILHSVLAITGNDAFQDDVSLLEILF